ncbi:MAG: arsenate reductase ArsC [Gemmatimonadota bacterium]|nr:arsenate reductase ArsC [Gemmatimonadota bacterium]
MVAILYICLENSNRSQIAEAFTRMHGAGRAEAYSAGSAPSSRVGPRAVAAMRERGYDLTTHRPKSLEEVPGGPWAWVVTMGCGDVCPDARASHREDWDLPDPRDMAAPEFAAVRDEIERRVLDLLARIDATTSNIV